MKKSSPKYNNQLLTHKEHHFKAFCPTLSFSGSANQSWFFLEAISNSLLAPDNLPYLGRNVGLCVCSNTCAGCVNHKAFSSCCNTLHLSVWHDVHYPRIIKHVKYLLNKMCELAVRWDRIQMCLHIWVFWVYMCVSCVLTKESTCMQPHMTNTTVSLRHLLL